MSNATQLPTIPCADPKAQFLHYRKEITEAINRTLESGWYILGKECEQFEKAFARYIGAEHCIGVANGTDAVALALRAVGVEPGNEVITVSHSAVATAAAIEQIGAVPVFCDIESETLCLDPGCLQNLVSAKTKAIVVVHIYGQPAKIDQISSFCQEKGIKLIEDCAQAHGAAIGEKKVGLFGDAAAFSFYPTKNLGALGDGGAVITSNANIAQSANLLRQYGWRERYISEVAGVNSRLDEIQAAVLSAKLPHLDSDNQRRRLIATQYSEALEGTSVRVPVLEPRILHAMHLYVVRTPQRDDLAAFLKSQGILTTTHYPSAIHQQPAYRGRIRGGDSLPVTESVYKEILSLPMYPELSEESVGRITTALRAWALKN